MPSFRRSVYVAQDIPEGGQLTKENLRIVRPGFGLAPKHFSGLIGKTVNRSLAKRDGYALGLFEHGRIIMNIESDQLSEMILGVRQAYQRGENAMEFARKDFWSGK